MNNEDIANSVKTEKAWTDYVGGSVDSAANSAANSVKAAAGSTLAAAKSVTAAAGGIVQGFFRAKPW